MQAGLAATGRVRAVKYKTNGEITADLSFDNHVLYSGLDALFMSMLNGSSYGLTTSRFSYLFLGTGTTEPLPTDTGLESRSDTLSGKVAFGGAGPSFSASSLAGSDSHADTNNHLYWSEITRRYDYGEGEAEGVWTELGLASNTSYDNPLTRALFRDENGNATSLTILSDEFLTIYYTLRFYDALGEPQTGTLTVGDQTVGYTFKQSPSNWTNTPRQYQYTYDFGIWGPQYPFMAVSANIDTESYSRAYDESNKTLTFNLAFGPTSEDQSISKLYVHGTAGYGSSPSKYQGLYHISLDSPIIKKADYRVTITVEIQLSGVGPQVTGVSLNSAEASSLTFSWDAYPNATQYNLVLRQAGTEVETMTITDPTTTATFTGLTASTQYHLDISADTPSRSGARSIHAASTTA